jgi:hypothetical protein
VEVSSCCGWSNSCETPFSEVNHLIPGRTPVDLKRYVRARGVIFVSHRRSTDKPYLEYEKNDSKYLLPSPFGYSGGLIFEYINPSSAQKKGKIWYPTLGKAVSVQYKTDSKTYIVGTTTRMLKKWLSE